MHTWKHTSPTKKLGNTDLWDVMPCSLAQNAIDSEEPAASIFRAAVNSPETLVIIYHHARNFVPGIILIMTMMKALLKIGVPVCRQMSKSS
jgi:hypothetical protein